MPVDTDVFALIDRVDKAPRLDETSVGKLFQISLRRTDDPGNPYLRIFRGEPGEASPVQRLELRVPAGNESSTQALLILTIRRGRGVLIDELRSRYGPPARVEFPQAAAPWGTPTYESYELPWGRLAFGYLPAGNNSLKEIIFDRK